MRPRVFISHSSHDHGFVTRMVEDLRFGRVEVWHDEWEIPSAASLREKIFSEGIGQCDLFFVYLTATSIRSKWVSEEIDVALLRAMESRGTLPALYIDADEHRALLRDDLKVLRIPTLNHETYAHCLMEVVSRAWEAAVSRRDDRIVAGIGVSGTRYDFPQVFDKDATDCVVVAQNLVTLISHGFLDHARSLLERGHSLTIILTTYEAMCAVDERAGEQFIGTVEALRDFAQTLLAEHRAGLKIHFHPGATSLSAMIRRETDRNTIVFTPKWATDHDPGSRIFCVIDERTRPDLYARLVGHVNYMTSPGWPSLEEMCGRLGIQ